jgi:putative transposase
MKTEYPLRALCATLEVSASGYYAWQQRQSRPSPRHQENQRLQRVIEQIHRESRKTYGSPRIQAQLRAGGQHHGRNRIGRLMRQAQICGRVRRRYRVTTTDSRHGEPIAPNRLATVPAASAPDRIWVADITYIPTGEGWLYLAAILDQYSRRVVGWAMSAQPDTTLVLSAWDMAVSQRQPPAGLLFHSDRGAQYASGSYRRALQAARAVASMSRPANCYDNAQMEAFWSTLKLELVYRQHFATRTAARRALFDYIEIFYNRQRLHSALTYQSPAQFELTHN